MSKNYQAEKFTNFKDIETDSQKKTILQKIISLNRASSIDGIITNRKY
jgi:hypothetical protein